jgi:hypothetical protein
MSKKVELIFLAWALGTNCNIYVPKDQCQSLQKEYKTSALCAQLWEDTIQEQHSKLHELTSRKLNAK